MFSMNRLDTANRAQILSMLCEGASMRSVSRLADVSINTVANLLMEAGKLCAADHDANVRNVKAFFSVKRSKFKPKVLLAQ